MSKTVTSLFHSPEKAADVVTRLEQAGISGSDITVHTSSDGDFAGSLHGLGVPTSDAHAYAEGVRRGGSLVVIECDDDEVDRVISILDGEGILDLDEQQSSWRSEGWTGGYDPAASSGAGATAGLTSGLSGGTDRESSQARMAGRTDMGQRDEVIPIVEEELHVGKREVSHGRVRINSHVVERPVQEQVTLRNETVEVERRPVSGDARTSALGSDPFRERTIEVEERDEQAVVSKEARVTEELVVRKDAEQRTETISDTVRKTEVEIQDERNARGTGTAGSTDRKR